MVAAGAQCLLTCNVQRWALFVRGVDFAVCARRCSLAAATLMVLGTGMRAISPRAEDTPLQVQETGVLSCRATCCLNTAC